jgi:hypothetical protein
MARLFHCRWYQSAHVKWNHRANDWRFAPSQATHGPLGRIIPMHLSIEKIVRSVWYFNEPTRQSLTIPDRRAPLLFSGHPDADIKLKGSECSCLAKPHRIAELIGEAAKPITHAAENIRRVKTSRARLKATTVGLRADLAASTRLLDESKAIRAGRPPPNPSFPRMIHRRMDHSTNQE